MKFFILGCNGMVGHVVAMYLKEHNHDVFGYDDHATVIGVTGITGSLDDYDGIRTLIVDGNYDAVINCTAVINQDAETNKLKAIRINSLLPRFLEQATDGTNTVVVHRSTDCIFSGRKGQYGLDDFPDANSFYAKSKVLGELNNNKDITIRTSLIGPEIDENGSGLFNWFYNQNSEVKGFGNAIWTGLTTIEFARETEWILENHEHGLFQLVPDHSISKYELLKLFEAVYPGNRRIQCIENERVDKSLIQIKPKRLIIHDYKTMIEEMREWTDKHRDLYRYE